MIRSIARSIAGSVSTPITGSGPTAFTPASLFASSEGGAWYDPSVTASLYQDDAGVTPVTAAGQTVGLMEDQSPNGIDATQGVVAARPTYQTTPDRLTLDKVDDRLIATIPAGGYTGTMVIGTPEGTAAYGVNIAAGSYDIGGDAGDYFPGSAIVGWLIRDGALTSGEIADLRAWMIAKGAGDDYGAVTDFSSFWRGRGELTSFPLIDTSSGTNFGQAWRDCSSLTSFPLIDTSSGTNFNSAWNGCSSLTSFPANAFDSCPATDFTDAFTNTALTQTSIDNILTSIDTANTSSGTFDQSGGSAPSATGEAAIDNLRARGWTVTVTGGY